MNATAFNLETQSSSEHVCPDASEGFVLTPHVQQLIERALTYLQVGYPVHLAGPSGTGKTTLAFHLAASHGQPVVLIHGDDEFGSSDLVGKDNGYRRSKTVDNYVHTVVKTEERSSSLWVENRLTSCCRDGFTLIYDEFTRSRPEANNVLLSVLEERILNLPKLNRFGEGYLRVHPGFRAIFTSNPEEYAGTHKSQDALMDRLITINMDHYDRETEIQITKARGGIDSEDAGTIVDLVRELRGMGVNNHRPSIRSCIAIASVLAHRGARARLDDPVFQWVTKDVLSTDTCQVTRDNRSLMPENVDLILQKLLGTAHEVPRKGFIEKG